MSYFGIVDKYIRKEVTMMHSFLQLGDVVITMLILLEQILPQLLYSIAKSIPKHIKFIINIYDNSQVVPTSWMDFYKEQKSDSEI